MEQKAKKNGCYRRAAFTLIELLVVISIIALLLSIMSPSLSRARNQARVVVCSSNLRQLGLAVSTYMVNNRDHYPPHWAMPTAYTDTAPYYDKTTWGRLLQSYLDSSNARPDWPLTKAFYCPLGPKPGVTQFVNQRDKQTRIWPSNNSHYVTYGYNSYALGDHKYFGETLGRKWNQTPTMANVRPSDFLIIVDQANFFEASASAWASPGNRTHISRHHPKDSANVLYGDTHVASETRTKLDDESGEGRWLVTYPWKVLWEK